WTIGVPYTVGQAVAPQTVTDTVTATSDENPGGIAASDQTDVVTTADLAVSGSATPDPALVGWPVAYSITIANAGPSRATSATLVATLPPSQSNVSISVEQGSCDATGTTVTCDLGSIDAGGGTTIHMSMRPTQAGLTELFAEVAVSPPDPSQENNSLAIWVTVVDPPPAPATNMDPTGGSPTAPFDARIPVLVGALGFWT